MAAADRHDLDHIFLVAPSSTPQRLRSTARACTGFVYAASSMGVTGARASVGDAAQVLVTRTRLMTDLPICVGLGVSTGDQAAQVAAFADGVIVGSALVRCLSDAGPPADALGAIRELSAALAAGVRQRC
jgi:tryptophan synthase alpha chain